MIKKTVDSVSSTDDCGAGEEDEDEETRAGPVFLGLRRNGFVVED